MLVVDRNYSLSIIIDKKNYKFLRTCMKSRCELLCWLRLSFLRGEVTLFFACLPMHYQTILSFYLIYRFSDVSRTRIHQNLKFYFFEVAIYFLLCRKITFSDIGNLFLERITVLENFIEVTRKILLKFCKNFQKITRF